MVCLMQHFYAKLTSPQAGAAAFKHTQGEPVSPCELVPVTSSAPGAPVQEGVLPSALTFPGSVPRASVRGQVESGPALFYSPAHQAPLSLPHQPVNPLRIITSLSPCHGPHHCGLPCSACLSRGIGKGELCVDFAS